jgi:Zn-finger nucleic acid-binding protein
MAERLCPGCGEGLAGAHLGPVGLDLCLSCAGVWFDRDELAEVVRAGPAVLRRLHGKVQTPQGGQVRRMDSAACPVCRTPMTCVEYPSMPGIRMTACGHCSGFWLDSETLEGIAAWLERTAQPQPPAPAVAAQPPAAPPAVEDRPAAEPSGKDGGTHPLHETRKCPDCGEPNEVRAATCWACGHALGAALAGACPRCGGILRHVQSDGILVDACEGCSGVWLKQGKRSPVFFHPEQEQRRVLQKIDSHRTGKQRGEQPELRCLDCGVPMVEAPLGTLSKLPVCTCPSCSACFVDRDTLEEIFQGKRW